WRNCAITSAEVGARLIKNAGADWRTQSQTPSWTSDRPCRCSADLHSAVSQNCVLRIASCCERFETIRALRRLQIGDTADCKSALREEAPVVRRARLPCARLPAPRVEPRRPGANSFPQARGMAGLPPRRFVASPFTGAR